MSSIDLISLMAATTFIVGYGVIRFFLSSQTHKKESLNLKRRLNELFKATTQAELRSSSLIKEPTSEIESYFKSRLPKIEGFTEWLQHAGLEIDPVVFGGASLLLGIVIFCLTFFIFQATFLFSILFGIASSFFLPWVLVSYLTNVQKTKFLAEFPTALDMIQRALRAGHSAERAIEMVASRITGPIGTSFQLISEKMSLGEPPEVVLAEISNRVGIDEFRMLSIVLILQRETGGSLAEAVENFAKIIRARQNLKKKVKALTGEVRATAMILTSIPFVITIIIYFTSPHYLDSLFYTKTGHTLLWIAGGMLTTGIIIIFRMAYKDLY
jgi:tight adherence protein B